MAADILRKYVQTERLRRSLQDPALIALCYSVRVTDKSRFIRLVGQVSNATLTKVEQAVSVTLGT